MACIVTALAATFLSEHYGAPAMLMALLLGMTLHFLIDDDRARPGIEFSARSLLRLGVALLGARVSLEMVTALGPAIVALLFAAVFSTIGFGLVGARLLGRRYRFGLLTGGAVAICGASAAMAIAAVLPQRPGPQGKVEAEQALLFTVLGVTLLSTIAMVAYPIISTFLELSDTEAGVFLGGTIHDVAQVVGAGFSISPQAGETATLVKLIRVSMLAPVVLIIALSVRRFGSSEAAIGEKPPIVPAFVAGFLILVALNSLGLIPPSLGLLLEHASRWALVTAIVAVGIKTSLRSVFDVGGKAIVLILAETVFIAALVLAGLSWLSSAA
ncbi:MAG: putative sulfate exporter family transporter [Pseudomonadota bacterium]